MDGNKKGKLEKQGKRRKSVWTHLVIKLGDHLSLVLKCCLVP